MNDTDDRQGREITQRFNELLSVIVSLQERMNELEDAMAPLVFPLDPQPAPSTATATAEVNTPFARDIHGACGRLSDLRDRISSLTDRLGIE